MNKERRAAIAKVQDEIQDALGVFEAAKETIENLRDEEQEYLEAMPESFKYGDKGDAATAAVEALEAAIESLDEIITSELDDHLSEAAA